MRRLKRRSRIGQVMRVLTGFALRRNVGQNRIQRDFNVIYQPAPQRQRQEE